MVPLGFGVVIVLALVLIFICRFQLFCPFMQETSVNTAKDAASNKKAKAGGGRKKK